MWGSPTLFLGIKSIEKSIETRQIFDIIQYTVTR